jgi:hypothetical protein
MNKLCSHCGQEMSDEVLVRRKARLSLLKSEWMKVAWEERAGRLSQTPTRRLHPKIFEMLDAGMSPKAVAIELNIGRSKVDYAIQVRRRDMMREKMRQKT